MAAVAKSRTATYPDAVPPRQGLVFIRAGLAARAVRQRFCRKAARTNRRILVTAVSCALATLSLNVAHAVEPMSFQLASIGASRDCQGNCADIIKAEGEIDSDTADRFTSFLAEHLQDQDLRPVILIHSPGGTVLGAMQLGTAFRKIGAAVIVAAARSTGRDDELQVAPGACLSACVYAFMGGKKRVIPPGSLLGIHRMVMTEEVPNPAGGSMTARIYGSPDFVATLSAYAQAMGVNPDVIDYAEHISPDSIHLVSRKEIKRWRLGSARF